MNYCNTVFNEYKDLVKYWITFNEINVALQPTFGKINGLGMMLYQGAASFKLWTDQDMPIDVVKEALDF